MKREVQFPVIAPILVAINGMIAIVSFEWPRGHISSEWFQAWAIIPEQPTFPQILTYWFLHFHLPHYLGVSALLLVAGAYGEWRLSKKWILGFYILGATVFALASVVILVIFLYLFPSVVILQWFSYGLNRHMVGSSAASFSVYGSLYPVVKPSHRPLYFSGLFIAILSPIIIFQTINIGDWAHLVVSFLAIGVSWVLYRRTSAALCRSSVL
ncbi:MAG: hypothetical protein ACFFGZ_08865 [Candidatus Thorarchaeota archaeon]